MSCIKVPEIMLPAEGTDLYKWSVVACDQYTSQPEYWKSAEEIAGDEPSALKLILPEVYLEDGSAAGRTEKIHETMKLYLSDGTLRQLEPGFILVERTTESGTRRGLVVAIDLEDYSYKKGDAALIRPTEKTVEERIPPRLAVRQGASLELPHIMILIDDPGRTVIEPLFNEKLQAVYDTELMLGGGHIKGSFVPEGPLTRQVMGAMDALLDKQQFAAKYSLPKAYPLLNCAVGDGNHSLATAKAYWEQVKAGLTPEEQESHPARYCLCELVNIHDESLIIEPIHRVLFGVDVSDLLAEAAEYYSAAGSAPVIEDETCMAGDTNSIEGSACKTTGDTNSIEGSACKTTGDTDSIEDSARAAGGDAYVIPFCSESRSGALIIEHPVWGTPLGALQAFLDDYVSSHKKSRMDYIHGDEVTRELGCRPGNIGFILPALKKEELFRGVIMDGVLPRKSFSMGHAQEKRFYLEAKKI